MKKTLVIVSALALGTTLVLAQSPGPGGGQGAAGQGQGQGGRGQGFGGRMQGMRGGGGIRIVTRPDVQKELNLTDQQKTAIQEKMPAMGGRGNRGGQNGGGAPGGGAAAGTPPAGGGGAAGANGGLPPAGGAPQGGRGGFGNNAEAQAKLDADIKAILSDSQYKRLHELMLQFDGPAALARPDVAKQFDLTEEQKKKIQDIQQTQMQNMRERMQGGGGGGERQAMMQEMQKMREETNKQILAVLTAEQKQKWDAAQGKSFKFEGRG